MSTAAVQIASDSADSQMRARMLRAAFARQREAYLEAPMPSVVERKADLKKLKAMVSEHREEFVEAINQDYGNRVRQETLFAEVISVTDLINHAIKNLGKWAKVQKRHTDWTVFAGARSRVIPQPLGVVGIIVPWNFPGYLSFAPLVSAFAAGNRAMVKMSENSRAFSRLLIRLSKEYFPEEKLMYFEETGGVGIEFSQIPFDLLFFTGSGETGKKVMESAARNLTPVVLELGGKSPAVIDPEFPIRKAVDRIMFVKQFNAGQICINVDYVFVHKSQVEEFVAEARAWVKKHVPDIHGKDYGSIIDELSFKRLQQALADASAKGAKVINLNAGQEPDLASRKMPLHLVLDTCQGMTIREREIFGPVMSVLTYDDPQEVIDYINAKDRPLAFYPFSNNKKLVQRYLDNVMSGTVAVNDALYQVSQHDMPFGGVGPSGMGHYHGREGFNTFSKLRPVFYQAPWSFMTFLRPPYGPLANSIYKFMLWFKD